MICIYIIFILCVHFTLTIFYFLLVLFFLHLYSGAHKMIIYNIIYNITSVPNSARVIATAFISFSVEFYNEFPTTPMRQSRYPRIDLYGGIIICHWVEFCGNTWLYNIIIRPFNITSLSHLCARISADTDDVEKLITNF